MPLEPVPGRRSDRAVGTAMIVISVAAAVVIVISSALAWQVSRQVARSVDQSLLLTEEALVTVDASLEAAGGVVDAVDGSLGAASRAVVTVSEALEETVGLIEVTGDLTAETAPALASLDSTLAEVEEAARTVDRILDQVSTLPLVPRYDPDVRLDASVAEIRADLSPIAESVARAGDDLAEVERSTGQLVDDLSAVTDQIEVVRERTSGIGALLDDYRGTVAEARVVAARSRSDLGVDIGRAGIAIVLLGLVLAAGQFTTFWLGRRLRGTPP